MSEPLPPQPTYTAPAPVPGKTMGIVALICSIVVAPLSVLWLILGIVSVVQSKKVGASNVPGVVAIIISALAIVATVIIIIVLVGAAVALGTTCADLGSGTHDVNGVMITCG